MTRALAGRSSMRALHEVNHDRIAVLVYQIGLVGALLGEVARARTAVG